ncbi:hypothetical protein ACMGDM_17320 [Sphingomonas sp. DT-51]|uniref:hypothetical protein n=1 Tax=Sphingomonas sp. DT-51 TaxID=3396165 RepID=UPI003F1C6FD8
MQTFGHGGYSSRSTLAQHLDSSDDVIGWSYYTRLSLCCDTPASLIDSNLYMTPDRLADFLTLQVGKPVEFGTG